MTKQIAWVTLGWLHPSMLHYGVEETEIIDTKGTSVKVHLEGLEDAYYGVGQSAFFSRSAAIKAWSKHVQSALTRFQLTEYQLRIIRKLQDQYAEELYCLKHCKQSVSRPTGLARIKQILGIHK